MNDATDAPQRAALLISMRPRFARAILAGEKRVELRRVRPGLAPGGLLVLYASSPIRQVLGVATLKAVIEGTPSQLWTLVGTVSGVSQPEFAAYFQGSARAFGLELQQVRKLSQPLPLSSLRENGIHAPQSFRYLRVEELLALHLLDI